MYREKMSSYKKLIETMASLDFSKSTAMAFLRTIDKALVIEALADVIASEALLSAIAADSYIHQLEFEKYVIGKVSANGLWLRLHHWPSSVVESRQDIHSHCASFASRVLNGSLRHAHYRKIPGDGYSEYQYRFDESTGVGGSVLSGYTGLEKYSFDEHHAGSVYCVDENLLHQVVAIDEGTITLSLWARRAKDAIVLRPNGPDATNASAKAGIAVPLLRSKLDTIIKRLG